MTRDLKRLQLVEDVFARREDTAARELARFRSVLEDACTQLKTLRAYRNDYLETMRRPGATSLSRLQNGREFVRRLEEAIAGQERIVARARADCATLASRHRRSCQRTRAVAKVCGHRRDAQRLDEDRREQKELDARSLLRRPGD